MVRPHRITLGSGPDLRLDQARLQRQHRIHAPGGVRRRDARGGHHRDKVRAIGLATRTVRAFRRMVGLDVGQARPAFPQGENRLSGVSIVFFDDGYDDGPYIDPRQLADGRRKGRAVSYRVDAGQPCLKGPESLPVAHRLIQVARIEDTHRRLCRGGFLHKGA